MNKHNTIQRDDLRDWRLYAADFETTTGDQNMTETRVWSFCFDEVGEYRPKIYGSINDFMDVCADVSLGIRKRFYFHNLKFDGNFILWHLIHVLGFRSQLDPDGNMERPEKLCNGECSYVISDVGQWYYIAFRYKNVLVECRDSLKILPFTLEQIGEAFCTKYKKLAMDYDSKESLADCSPEDIKYIENDVLVLSEALSFIMKRNGEESPFDPVRSLTIGGACLQEFKAMNYGENKSIAIKLDKMILPDVSEIRNGDEYCRSGYRGGYCYVKEEKQGITINGSGFTADVNSLYPFAMCYAYSGNRYPFGKGVYHLGRPEQRMFESDEYYFYMRIRVSFILKDGFVPTIQKKNSFLFLQNAYLKCSKVMDFASGKYVGNLTMIELTLTKDDWLVFEKHYEIRKIEYIDYISFMTASELFDRYIKKFAKIKQESKGAVRNLAKLFQNDLYGQMAKGTNSSFKMVSDRDFTLTGGLDFDIIQGNSKKVVNIAIGAAITAKARRYQIETIQNNFDRFIYSDTDSLHCAGRPEDFVGKIDSKIYGAYKIEATWRKAKYVRQKTYIEEWDQNQIDADIRDLAAKCEKTGADFNLESRKYFEEKRYLNICAAGMTPEQKQRFRNEYSFEDFRPGLTIKGGKLKPVSVPGGVILIDVDFTIR